jgi:hypothetical protein
MVRDRRLIQVQLAEKLPRLEAPFRDDLFLAAAEDAGQVLYGAVLEGGHRSWQHPKGSGEGGEPKMRRGEDSCEPATALGNANADTTPKLGNRACPEPHLPSSSAWEAMPSL